MEANSQRIYEVDCGKLKKVRLLCVILLVSSWRDMNRDDHQESLGWVKEKCTCRIWGLYKFFFCSVPHASTYITCFGLIPYMFDHHQGHVWHLIISDAFGFSLQKNVSEILLWRMQSVEKIIEWPDHCCCLTLFVHGSYEVAITMLTIAVLLHYH